MTTITTNSSTRVKPRARLPVTIGNPVQTDSAGLRVHIENVITRLRIVRRAPIGAQAPHVDRSGGGIGPEGIARHVPKKIDLHTLFGAAGIFDTIYQRL